MSHPRASPQPHLSQPFLLLHPWAHPVPLWLQQLRAPPELGQGKEMRSPGPLRDPLGISTHRRDFGTFWSPQSQGTAPRTEPRSSPVRGKNSPRAPITEVFVYSADTLQLNPVIQHIPAASEPLPPWIYSSGSQRPGLSFLVLSCANGLKAAPRWDPAEINPFSQNFCFFPGQGSVTDQPQCHPTLRGQTGSWRNSWQIDGGSKSYC